MLGELYSNVHTLGSAAVAGTAAGGIDYPGVQRLEEVARHRRMINLRGMRGDRHRRGIHVADGTLAPGTKNDSGVEGFNKCTTFTSTTKVMRKGVLPVAITGMLIAVLISMASAPAIGSPGCAGYVKPFNHAESFWRQAEEQQVRVCIGRFGVALRENTQNLTPLHLAAYFGGNPEVITALLKGGADPNATSIEGGTPLHLAAQVNANPAIVLALLKGGADPNATSIEGGTPLHLAAQENANPAIVLALLKGGADPNATSPKGSTPLHLAAEANANPAIVVALLKGGADPNATTTKGATPLHMAAELNANSAIVVALLKGGADPNATTTKGSIPLHHAAAFNENPEVLAELLKGGADPKAELQGKTAFELAGNNPKLRGSDVYRLLRDAQQESTVTPVTLDPTKEDYLATQRLLNEKGFEAGPEDGIWGSKSRDALRAFQAQAGLAQTGVPDKATRMALGFQETAESDSRDVSGANDGVALRHVCKVDQELEPGQGCRIPGGGEFKVESDGCVKEVPDVPGPISIGTMSLSGNIFSKDKEDEDTLSTCIGGHLGKGQFKARYDAEKSIWRIESLPEAN